MKTIYFHYGNGVETCFTFFKNATLQEIALKIGDNAIITKII